MLAYADTGFLISLYGLDSNSGVAATLAKRRPTFLLTPLGEAEFSNAIELRIFRKQWTRRDAEAVASDFLQDQRSGVFQIEALTPAVWQTALTLSRQHTAKLGVRTFDLLHVATVKVFKPDAFYTFDQRQRALASAQRLPVLPV